MLPNNGRGTALYNRLTTLWHAQDKSATVRWNATSHAYAWSDCSAAQDDVGGYLWRKDGDVGGEQNGHQRTGGPHTLQGPIREHPLHQQIGRKLSS